MRHFSIYSKLLFLCVSLSTVVVGETVFWPQGASRQAPVILLPDSPSVTEQFAATELRDVVAKMGLGSMEILPESSPDTGAARIYIGACRVSAELQALAQNDIRTLRVDTAITHLNPDSGDLHLLGGGDRGSLYAVYGFLELQGCRWFEPGPEGEWIPQVRQLQVPARTLVEQPVFAVREIGRGVDEPSESEALIDWCAKNRLNRLFSLRSHPAWRKRGGTVHWQHLCHNSTWMVTNEEWFESHPEYFSLYNGRRIPQGKEGGYLCTTNPEVQQLVADFVLEWFARYPEGDMVPISPPDGAVKWCECDQCMALGGENFTPGPAGSMTRRQVEFMNAVGSLVAKENPDARILLLAYADTVWPYEGLKLRENIVVQVAHGYAGNGSLVHPIGSDWNADARDVFDTWAKAAPAGIGIWDYFILRVQDRSGSALTPLGFGKVAFDMVDYLAAFPNPYKVYFTQAGNTLQQYNPFLYYALARKLWQPDLSLDAVRTDYTQHRYGAEAGPEIASYLQTLDEAYGDSQWNPEIWRDITVPSPRVFTPQVLAALHASLERAGRALPAGPSLARKAYIMRQASLDYVDNAVRPKLLVASESGDWTLERGTDAYVLNAGPHWAGKAQWAALRDQAIARGQRDDAMRRVLFRTLQRREEIVWLENDRLRIGVLPGIGGRIIRMMDRQQNENILFEPMNPSTLTDPGASYFRYGGYEEYTRKAFASPGWEMPMVSRSWSDASGTYLSMQGVTRERIEIERTLHLPPGRGMELSIQTRLTNHNNEGFPALLRVHPEFQLSPMLSGTHLLLGQADGSTTLRSLLGADLGETPPQQGRWGLVTSTGMGFLHEYPDGQSTPHLHLDRSQQSVNLELLTAPQLLAPGEQLTFSHQYKIFASLKDAPASVQKALKYIPVPSAPQGLQFVEGHEGKGLRLASNATPRIEEGTMALSDSGYFETWVCLDSTPSKESDALLFSGGTRQPDYMVFAIRDGKLVFYRTQRTEDTEVAHNAWLKVDAMLPDWTPGTWHQVAVRWENRGEGRSVVTLSVDGSVVVERKDLDMVPFRQPVSVSLGWDSSNASRPRFPGVFDSTQLSIFSLAGKRLSSPKFLLNTTYEKGKIP
ncbi:DUF4838 domain-containing protein [Kiritimatiellota bacterium B12222]|nr:DUF4838 domain-containing protein [Kiritimatiellota bacterium B12222]